MYTLKFFLTKLQKSATIKRGGIGKFGDYTLFAGMKNPSEYISDGIRCQALSTPLKG